MEEAVNQKSLYSVILDYLYERPDECFTLFELAAAMRNKHTIMDIAEQFGYLQEDGLIADGDKMFNKVKKDILPNNELITFYRISYKGFQFVEDKKHRTFTAKLDKNAHTLNWLIAGLTFVTLLSSGASLWINYKTIPLFEKANKIQEEIVTLTKPDTVKLIQTVTVHDTVQIVVPVERKMKSRIPKN